MKTSTPTSRTSRVVLAAAMALAFAAGARGADPFSEHVRSTDPLSPGDERRAFRLPPGFEIQLVAAEPQIQKPMNLAFDARGRIWVSGSVEYPWAAPADRESRDTIRVLEDTDGDGLADVVTTFADGLNIPIGVLPYGDGCIAWSIPHIWRLRDRDGDGRADERQRLLGPFGFERDTHGMNNAFRRTFDGWVYACHGFNNQTSVAGADGHAITMHSGNTYRFRTDGSRIEQYTWGQVNPFGMATDAFGNLFTADCHSAPIYELVRGGHYPSFGKPHDGLGFVPPVMRHGHGSTAISGVAYYTGDNFPPEYRGNLFVGNVFTSRVNRDSIVYHGSTVEAREEPDFVATTDPWFRPVDLRVGPDGALYIADFYNRIIGHYEVPLDHPGRDRHRGRIWRVVYRDADNARPDRATKPARRPPDLSTAGARTLIDALAHPSLTRRLLATNELVDRLGPSAVEPVAAALADPHAAATVRAHGLWVLHRLGALRNEQLLAASRDAAESVRVHAMRIAGATDPWSSAERSLVLAGLADRSPMVRRAASGALARHPALDNVLPLLEALRQTPDGDTYLRQAIRIALRDQLRGVEDFARLPHEALEDDDADFIAGIAVAVPSEAAAAFLIDHVERREVERDRAVAYLAHAAQHVPLERVDDLVGLASGRIGHDDDLQLALLASIKQALDRRGAAPGRRFIEWGRRIATALLDAQRESGWVNLPVPGVPPSPNPWVLERRRSSDGDDRSIFVCSLPRGEQLTGSLRSRAFTIPPRLRFFAAGHIGPPDRPVIARNFIRLRDAETDEILVESTPPRNDTAQPIEWGLEAWSGRRGVIEIVDGDTRGAYAWLAVGRFDPEVVRMPAVDPGRQSERVVAAATIVRELRLVELLPRLEEIVVSRAAGIDVRAAAAQALVAHRPDERLAALAPLVAEPGVPGALREKICGAIVERDDGATGELLVEAVRATPARLQARVALALAGSAAGAEALLGMVERGHASPRLLQRDSVVERIIAAGARDAARRVEELTADLPSVDENAARLVRQRIRLFTRSRGVVTRGAEVYRESCAACHRIGEEGGLIGPQLDGIGNRGVERLVEDLLDVNRNVDVAFRTSTFVLRDGTIVTGLFRREEGKTVVVADVAGKEIAIPAADIVRRIQGESSLMPDNFAEAIPVESFNDLLAYLLAQTGGK